MACTPSQTAEFIKVTGTKTNNMDSAFTSHLKTATNKYGLWENGKRIVWFDKDSIKEIEEGSQKWIDYFKDSDSASIVDKKAKFDKPKGFDMKLLELQERLKKL